MARQEEERRLRLEKLRQDIALDGADLKAGCNQEYESAESLYSAIIDQKVALNPLRLVITDAAKADLRSIHGDFANEKAGPLSTERFLRDLTEKLFDHAGKELCGSPRGDLSPGLRGLPYRGRCFYFRVIDDQLVVVGALSSKQDVTSQEFPEA